MTKALLAFEDGRSFACESFTGEGESAGEVVFNTSMSGYQEVLTDPSYRGQMVVMTYPLIGNYGVNREDMESDRVQVAAFIVRQYQDCYSNYRASESLRRYLASRGILGVHGIDTRAVTRHIRKAGAMRAVISTQDLDPASLAARARQIPKMQGRDLVSGVSTRIPYFWQNDAAHPCPPDTALDHGIWRSRRPGTRVAAFDFGIKYNILRCLAAEGLEVLVLPAHTSADAVRALSPDGIFLSNGPGDPEPLAGVVGTIRELIGYRPMFGICLGIQLIGLALGAATYKLKFGHHGSNQPVQNLASRRVEITSQNHGFVVDWQSLDPGLVEVTHRNLNDNTVEGFRHRSLPLFAVQYHPEAAPGPRDARYLFREFADLMAAENNA
ncbi:MAG TPA: glutamine-hydrolyzing carbamoyl-phosphate synthase small subunit [Desulfosalsimonadaceae bacterium]|nr:glutamine-hydrolyzing carbamoyl-phosphate synthase small subunit [Desulfosalsimonadaceae bacterium]